MKSMFQTVVYLADGVHISHTEPVDTADEAITRAKKWRSVGHKAKAFLILCGDTPESIQWHELTIPTNTYDEGIPYETKLREFREFLWQLVNSRTTDEEMELLYNEFITINIQNHEINIPFGAVEYNGLIDYIDYLIEEA